MNEIIYAGRHSVTYDVPRHSHSTLELVYCTGGKGQFIFEETYGYESASIKQKSEERKTAPNTTVQLPYKEGEIVVIPPRLSHSNASDTGFTNIHINLGEPTVTYTEPTLLRDNANHFLLNAFSAAYYHFTALDGRPQALLNAYGQLLACYLDNCQDEKRHGRVTEDISKTIIENYQNPDFALDDYLRSLPFSYDYLRRLFKNEMGVTPHRYLTDRRLNAAANMLSMGQDDQSISSIALSCGFRDALYFSRSFKKQFDVSPSEYFRLYRAKSDENPYLDKMNVKIMPNDSSE